MRQNDFNEKYAKKICLTFDMDWANDTVLAFFYQLLKSENVPATIMVTHETGWLEIFRKDPAIELGIHPNFNRLLGGENDAGNYRQVVDHIMKLVPEAVSYRSHALTDSSPIISYCQQKGLRYNLNMYCPPQDGICMVPFKRSDITMIPFIFEDDIWLLEEERRPVGYYLSDYFTVPRVFNFHPIHLYLNCEVYGRYEKAKCFNQEPVKLESYRNKVTHGIENYFRHLVEYARTSGFEFCKVEEMF